MNNKEQIIHFVLAKIKLSGYDRSFFSAVYTSLLASNFITSNQAKLVDTLILKYKKQFAKFGYDAEKLIDVEWKATVSESNDELIGARVSISEDGDRIDQILLKTSFNKKFISWSRNVRSSLDPLSGIEWDRESRHYIIPFSIPALKALYTVLPDFFSKVTYAPKLYHLIKQAVVHQNYTWAPTLVCVSGRYLIVAANPHLMSEIDTLDLTPTPHNLFKLSRYGIKVDPDIIKDDPILDFASSPVVNCDLTNIDQLAQFIIDIGTTELYITQGARGGGGFKFSKARTFDAYHTAMQEKFFKEYPLPVFPAAKISSTHLLGEFAGSRNDLRVLLTPYSMYDSTALHYQSSLHIDKVIVIKNSQPIDVK